MSRYFYSCTRLGTGIDFGSNCVLERVEFGAVLAGNNLQCLGEQLNRGVERIKESVDLDVAQ